MKELSNTQINNLINKMKECQQMEGLSVYDHGISVREYLFDIIHHLRYNKPLKNDWKIPDWVFDNKDYILSNLMDDDTLKLYTELHDCGKPFCLEIDSDGRRHFPNHSEVSYQIFNKFYNNKDSAELIRMDMDFHLLKSIDLEKFSESKYAITLMLTALAEIHSNSIMFGGMDSTSFKIKWKHINKKGKQVLNQKINK